MALVSYQFNNQIQQCSVVEGRTLISVIQEIGLDIPFPCNGNQRCGKCRVIAQGELSKMEGRESALLGDDAPPNMRLACFAKILGDVAITVPSIKKDDRIAFDFNIAAHQIDPIYSGNYGCAVDIGTTTIAAYLYCRDSMEILAIEGDMNSQQRFGADVLSRIDYANKNGVAPLQKAIRDQLNSLLQALIAQAGVQKEEVGAACITGNTVMLHLLEGLDPKSLAMAPFDCVSHFGDYATWHLEDLPRMDIYLPRAITAYVGPDITCSILASGMYYSPKNTLLIDIGTNGEMALKTAAGLVCCSTAAGPAFEGAGISSGMSAKPGAISLVWVKDNDMAYKTIDEVEAIGLCGSGLIDAVSSANKLEIINSKGKIVDAPSFTIGNSKVKVTQQDVRQLQMAKAAIRAGIDTLLESANIEYEALDEVILCGGFGSFLNPQSAAGIGMIPQELAAKCRAIGNGAGAGASMILQNAGLLTESKEIADAADTIELSYSKVFSKRYIDSMHFPKT